MLALYAYRNPTAFVSAAIDFSSPVRKCQPLPGAGAVVPLQVGRLLRRRQLRRLLRIEAHGDDVELLADAELQHAQRARQAVQHLRAEHRALVVHERQDHRPLAEELAEPHVTAGFVLERADRAAPACRASDRGRSRSAAPAACSTAAATTTHARTATACSGPMQNQQRGTSRLRRRSEPWVSLARPSSTALPARRPVALQRALLTEPGARPAWSLEPGA